MAAASGFRREGFEELPTQPSPWHDDIKQLVCQCGIEARKLFDRIHCGSPVARNEIVYP
ncbi:MAG: hypothetical protein R6V25_06180 [Desulfatiglandales bacterium]